MPVKPEDGLREPQAIRAKRYLHLNSGDTSLRMCRPQLQATVAQQPVPLWLFPSLPQW